MGAVYAWMIIFLFIGPEMSEEERKEYAATADDLEGLRKQGVSLQEIARERARRAWEAEHGIDESSDDMIEKTDSHDGSEKAQKQHIEAAAGTKM